MVKGFAESSYLDTILKFISGILKILKCLKFLQSPKIDHKFSKKNPKIWRTFSLNSSTKLVKNWVRGMIMINFQIEEYLKKKLIYMYEPGFRADQSLDFCLSLNHRTTFDILDHKIHFEKAKYSSFQASLIKRFESCLSNRTYLVCIENIFPRLEH